MPHAASKPERFPWAFGGAKALWAPWSDRSLGMHARRLSTLRRRPDSARAAPRSASLQSSRYDFSFGCVPAGSEMLLDSR